MGAELRYSKFDFNYDKCQQLRQEYWSRYTQDQFMKFHVIRGLIQEFYADIGQVCDYGATKRDNDTQEHYTVMTNQYSATFVTSNDHTPLFRMSGKYKHDCDTLVAQLQEYRRKLYGDLNHPLHRVIRAAMKLLMNLPDGIIGVIWPTPKKHNLTLMLVWKDWFGREAFVFSLTDMTEKIL